MPLLTVYFAVFACAGILCPPNRGVFLTFALVIFLLASLLALNVVALFLCRNRKMFLVSIKFLSKHLLGFYHEYCSLNGYAIHYLFCDR